MGGGDSGAQKSLQFGIEEIAGTAVRARAAQDDPRLQALLQTGLAPGVQQAFEQQAQVTEAGRGQAVQASREQAAARGLFSSGIGLGLEQQAQLDVNQQLAQQRLQQAQLGQQGIFQALGAQQGLLGLQSQLAGQRLQGEQAVGAAKQQAQGDIFGDILSAGKLVAAPFTGGASLALPF